MVVGARRGILAAAEAADADLRQLAVIVELRVHFAHGQHSVLIRAREHRAAPADCLAQPFELVGLYARRRRGVVNADEKAHIVQPLGGIQRTLYELQLARSGLKVGARDRLVIIRYDLAVSRERVALDDVFYRERVAVKLGPRLHGVFAQGVVVVERVAVVADRRRKAHDRVEQPDLVLRRGKRSEQALNKLGLAQDRAVGKRDSLAGKAAGVDKSAGQELVERQNVAVAAGLLLREHPLVQSGAVAVFKAAFAERLSVEPRAVVLLVRHDELIAERACQIRHPVGVDGAVVQRNVGNCRPAAVG